VLAMLYFWLTKLEGSVAVTVAKRVGSMMFILSLLYTLKF
jgi:hypothetical protein